VLVNPTRATELQPEVLKSISFLASFFLVFFLVATVTRSARDADSILRTLVGGMAVVGLLAVVESRTGLSPFGRLSDVLPVLHESADDELVRGGGTRARGPAEHPIALSAALVLAVPIAFYLVSTAKSKRVWWWLALGATSIGALATLSRTGVMMLAIVALVYLILRPRETLRFWPALIPLLAVIHFALPGALGSLRASFFPEGGVIAQQQNPAYSCISSGRLADIGPTLDEVARQPLLGIGQGTRIVTGENVNACILDNQWLGTLLETGAIGLIAWVWLFTRFFRLAGGAAARRNRDGELCVALVAAVAAYAVGMFTYDALSFVQVTFILFLLMGVGASVLARTRQGLADEPAPASVRSP
jgi:polysaccharide biosynthesis protein PslJ